MQKTKRLLAIEKIITEETISTQEELLKRLKGKGISCTQATLSRDLRQLGVSRIPNGANGYRYALTEKIVQVPGKVVKQNMGSVITSVVDARGLLVMKTIPGNAGSVAFFIDNSGRYEIAGTIAGDDTILIIPRDEISIHQVHKCLEIIFPGLNKQLKMNIKSEYIIKKAYV
jgi:transcriptional regulator of arginine metabolism